MKILLLITGLLIGTNSAFAQSSFKFIVNNNQYIVSEESLDSHFGKLFNDLVRSRTTKNKNFELWSKSYLAWKNSIRTCSISWRLYGTNPAEIQLNNCNHLPYEVRGRSNDGEVASGNPNDPKNNARRISFIIGGIIQSLSNEIIRRS